MKERLKSMNKGLKVGLIITGSVLVAGGIVAGITVPLVQQAQAKKVFYFGRFGHEYALYIDNSLVYRDGNPNELIKYAKNLISKGYRYGGKYNG